MSDTTTAWMAKEIERLKAQLAEWERLGVKVWEDCPNQCDQGIVLTDVCGCGRINHAEHFEERECADCDGLGKVPAEGVWQAEVGIGRDMGLLDEKGRRVAFVGDAHAGRYALVPLEVSDDE